MEPVDEADTDRSGEFSKPAALTDKSQVYGLKKKNTFVIVSSGRRCSLHISLEGVSSVSGSEVKRRHGVADSYILGCVFFFFIKQNSLSTKYIQIIAAVTKSDSYCGYYM